MVGLHIPSGMQPPQITILCPENIILFSDCAALRHGCLILITLVATIYRALFVEGVEVESRRSKRYRLTLHFFP